MRETFTVLVGLLLSTAAHASEAVSAAFCLDSHYDSQGEAFTGESGTEVSGVSDRWTAQTATWSLGGGGSGASASDGTGSSAASEDPFVTDTRVYGTGGNPTFDVTFAVVRVSDAFVCDTGGSASDGDLDGDGIPDWWEELYSDDGGKTSLDASDDGDDDGFSNYGEFVALTDPTDGASKFSIGIAPKASSSYAVQWQSVEGRTYAIYVKTSLADEWPATPVAELTGTGGLLEYVPDGPNDALFFKVTVRLSDGQ